MAILTRKLGQDVVALDSFERNIVIASLRQNRNRKLSTLKKQSIDPTVIKQINEVVNRIDHLISIYESTKPD